MDITVDKRQGKVPIAVVQPHGDIDASNYTQLVKTVEGLIKDGAQDFVIDLSQVPFMSSAGLAGLHTVALLLRGEKLSDSDSGWGMLKSMDRSRASGMQQHVKLVAPQAGVAETFDKAGFTQFFHIFKDVPEAVASF